jgi:sulfoxide reductase heme-binding subunit YedZ
MKRLVKPLLFTLCVVPLAWLIWDALHAGLGANPIEALEHRTGDWALRFLLVTLAVTPLRRLTQWTSVVRYRRMFGLFAFFYVCLHFLTYFVLDLFFAFENLAEDVAKRPYITVGFLAFLLMVPLAVTSTKKMMRRLGRRWKQLHRLVYGVAALGVLHYIWLVKADVREPMIYAAILALLLGSRVWFALAGRVGQRLSGRTQFESQG